MNKISNSLLLLLLISILVISLSFCAGCTDASKSSFGTDISWTGVWNSTTDERGIMTLIQEGETVSGIYNRSDADPVRVSGILSEEGYILTGRWESNSAAGPFELAMDTGQAAYSGWWMNETVSEETTPIPWNGTRTTPLKVSWTGIWKDEVEGVGEMKLHQAGNTVQGTYGYDGDYGAISGTLSGGGYILTGRWSENGAEGLFEFTMTPRQDAFTGWWIDGVLSDDTTKNPWNAIRSMPASESVK